ncbi:MAG: acyloxyacyl hydrolase [Bacteroidales bacterium]|nr:acyloxyacyl hydrolase [Bacteroidales bacterium]
MRNLTILFIFFGLFKSGFGIEGEKHKKAMVFIQPGFMIGKALPGNSNFPETSPQTIYSLSIGKFHNDTKKLWAVYLNYPSTGLMVSYSNYGNKEVFGRSITVMPYFSLNTSRRHFNAFHVRIGLGATYFSRSYNKYSNPRNLAIGSRLNWVFQTTAYYNLLLSKYADLNFGLGFIHHSNGHTKMPNLGLNSVLFSISSRIYLDPVQANNKEVFRKPKHKQTRQYFLMARVGIGIHEFGGPNSETGGVKRAVDIISLGAGTIFKQVLKLRAGFTYRFYQHYYNYIIHYQPEEYKDKPIYSASNLQVFFGGELLLGHIGVDGEIGINVFKPFYSYHQELYGYDEGIKKWLKSAFSTRLGLKLYLVNTSDNPKDNLFIGAYINANLSQADFSEISLGYVRRFGMRNN